MFTCEVPEIAWLKDVPGARNVTRRGPRVVVEGTGPLLALRGRGPRAARPRLRRPARHRAEPRGRVPHAHRPPRGGLMAAGTTGAQGRRTRPRRRRARPAGTSEPPGRPPRAAQAHVDRAQALPARAHDHRVHVRLPRGADVRAGGGVRQPARRLQRARVRGDGGDELLRPGLHRRGHHVRRRHHAAGPAHRLPQRGRAAPLPGLAGAHLGRPRLAGAGRARARRDRLRRSSPPSPPSSTRCTSPTRWRCWRPGSSCARPPSPPSARCSAR